MDTRIKREENTWWDNRLQKRYRGVVAGFAWPGTKDPGYIVVLGEEETKKANEERRSVFVIDEIEVAASSFDLCCERLQEVNDRYVPAGLYGDHLHEVGRRSINAYCDRLYRIGRRGPGVSVPPYFSEKRYYESAIAEIVSMTRRDRKCLFFGELSRVPAEIHEYEMDPVRKFDPERYPKLTAMIHAVTAVSYSSRSGAWAIDLDSGPGYAKGQAIIDYDIFTTDKPHGRYER